MQVKRKGIKQKGDTSICYGYNTQDGKNLMLGEKMGLYNTEDCDL